MAFLLEAPGDTGHHMALGKEQMFMSSSASPFPIIHTNLIMGSLLKKLSSPNKLSNAMPLPTRTGLSSHALNTHIED